LSARIIDADEVADGESGGISSEAVALPPSLFPEAPAGASWFVLHTRSRQEKAVADALRALQTWCFLPLVTHTRVYRGRKMQVQLPLIPSYVFMKGQAEEAYQLDRNKRLANIIPVTNQVRLEWELGNIRRAIDAHVALDPYPYLKKGIRAEVRSGPLRGTQGIIEDRTKLTRLILQVEMLGRAVSLEMDGALLEPLE
jgi:transcription antitermination factor NusG